MLDEQETEANDVEQSCVGQRKQDWAQSEAHRSCRSWTRRSTGGSSSQTSGQATKCSRAISMMTIVMMSMTVVCCVKSHDRAN